MIKAMAIVLFYLILFGSGTYLVATEHYGWAWIPFLLAATADTNILK